MAKGALRGALSSCSPTGTSERYAREWLEHQAAGGIVTATDGRYEPAAEHAEVLLDEESLRQAAPLARFAVSLLPVEHDAFRCYRPN
jgi:hypothetical protein